MNQSILNQQKSQSGFTLVELIVVIVLLGILGVTALGKFQDLSADASAAATQGVASEITSGSSINYAKSLLSAPAVPIGVGESGISTGVNACLKADLEKLLTGTMPSSYTVASATNACAANDTYSCTITGDNASTAIATIICTN